MTPLIAGGRRFYKMSGSGNDFVMVDARGEPPGALADPARIQAVCARATGVGADGIVFLEPSSAATLRMTYLNSDGSRAAMCGNASLCTTRLAMDLGAAPRDEGFTIETDSGILQARWADGAPEVDLEPVTDVRPSLDLRRQAGERRIGYALVGVPHVVLEVDHAERVDVVGRGRPLRHHEALRPLGANVNFVSADPGEPGRWTVRTYERGVEGETLACGTGAVATAILLASWGAATSPVALRTRSGRTLRVRLTRSGGAWLPSLSGEARLVFAGEFGEL